MLISNLQNFIRLLAPPLAAAGINATSQKSITGSLESLAEALEPFKALSPDQLADLLKIAEEYRQSGKVPDWVLDRKPPTSRLRVTKAPKMTVDAAVAQLRDLQHRSANIDPSQVAGEVRELSSLSVKDLQEVQRIFLGAVVGKKKDELLAALQRKVDDFHSSRDRVGGILAQ